jgi:hypothetical protein
MAKPKKKAKFEMWSIEEIETLIDAVFQHGNASAKLHSAMLKKDKNCSRSQKSVKLKLKNIKNAFDMNSEEKVKAMRLESKVEMHHEKKCRVEKHLNERGRKEIASKYVVRMNFDILVCS